VLLASLGQHNVLLEQRQTGSVIIEASLAGSLIQAEDLKILIEAGCF